jgi:hypothetical protein
MVVAKGPGGIYWMVMNDEGEVVSTHPTKELADKATGYSDRITTGTEMNTFTYQNKMAKSETMK